MPDNLTVGVVEHVATIRLDRGRKRNALTWAMYADLADALAEFARREEIRLVVVTGSDGSFTAGNDLDDLSTTRDLSESSPPRRFLDALVALPQVLIMGVSGPAIAVGTTILLHADLVLATRSSVFAMPFVNLGLTPEAASTLLLPAAVGHVRAAELLLLGRRFTADEALRWGLINEVIDGAQPELDEALGVLVSQLLAQPADALRQTRRLLRAHRQEATRARLMEDGALLGSFAATMTPASKPRGIELPA